MDCIKLNSIAFEIKKILYELSTKEQAVHLGPSLSCVEIFTSLFANDIYKKNTLLSKGHAVATYYATLVAFDEMNRDELLKSFFLNGSNYLGHPSTIHLPELIWSTGSLGHGLSVASGMAYKRKITENQNPMAVILSDGDCNAGQTWEAAAFSADRNLDNLLAIVDANGVQAFEKTNSQHTVEALSRKFDSYGWNVVIVNDGHNIESIMKAIQSCEQNSGSPSVILAKTVKGNGMKNVAGTVASHYEKATQQTFKEFLETNEK